jgi:hypothetical protein
MISAENTNQWTMVPARLQSATPNDADALQCSGLLRLSLLKNMRSVLWWSFYVHNIPQTCPLVSRESTGTNLHWPDIEIKHYTMVCVNHVTPVAMHIARTLWRVLGGGGGGGGGGGLMCFLGNFSFVPHKDFTMPVPLLPMSFLRCSLETPGTPQSWYKRVDCHEIDFVPLCNFIISTSTLQLHYTKYKCRNKIRQNICYLPNTHKTSTPWRLTFI